MTCTLCMCLLTLPRAKNREQETSCKVEQEKHNESGVAAAVLQLQRLPEKLLLGMCFIFKALFEHAHTLPVATFVAFQVCSFITLSSAERGFLA